jgi:hypothetical protein
MNYPRILSFDELPPYPVRSLTHRNEQVRLDEAQRVIVYNVLVVTGDCCRSSDIIVTVNNLEFTNRIIMWGHEVAQLVKAL